MAKKYYLPKLTDLPEKLYGYFLWSEKLDGVKAFWDGGISRGMTDCPWSNDTRKSTGLWTSNGRVISCPPEWASHMPDFPVEGELYMGRGVKREHLVSTVRSYTPDERWQDVALMVFDAVPMESFMAHRRIEIVRDVNGNRRFFHVGPMDTGEHRWAIVPKAPFLHRLVFLANNLVANKHLKLIEHKKLYGHVAEMARHEAEDIVKQGGEGVVLRDENALWIPERSKAGYKCKPRKDAEGVLLGYLPGNRRLEGMIGSLQVKWGDKEIALGNLTDEQRQLSDGQMVHFQPGQRITFTYRTLTSRGMPEEARFKCVRDTVEG